MSELEPDIDRLHFGDLVRVPRQQTCWVVVGKEAGGRTSARAEGPSLSVTVDAREWDEQGMAAFAYTRARLFDPVTGRIKTVEPPLERVEEPARWLRLQPPTPVVFALLAWHTRDRQMEREREGFGLSDAVARVLREAGASEVDVLA